MPPSITIAATCCWGWAPCARRKDFDRALLLAPGYAAAYSNRAGALMKLGEIDQAIADYTKAIALTPANAAALNGRGGRIWRPSARTAPSGISRARSRPTPASVPPTAAAPRPS